MTIKKTKRNDEIIRLRNEENWLLREIAEYYDISRERVRQIVSKSEDYKPNIGRYPRTLGDPDFIKNTSYLTNNQLSEMLGVGVSTVIKHRGDVRHRPSMVHDGFKKSFLAQEKVYYILTDRFKLSCTLQPFRRIPHIVTETGLGIVVRPGNPSTPTNDGITSPQYRFRLSHKESVHFHVFYLLDADEYFIVPKTKTKNYGGMIFFCYPNSMPRADEDSWQNHKDNWWRIIDAENARKEVLSKVR